eukprot:6639395-Heterocapsa_arctica.AAC.2
MVRVDRLTGACAARHGMKQVSIISSTGPRLLNWDAVVIDQTHSAAVTPSTLELERFQELEDLRIAPIGAACRPLDLHSSTVLDTLKRNALEFLPDLVEEVNMSVNLSLSTRPETV